MPTNPTPKNKGERKVKKLGFDPYCNVCGGCGFIGCDGIELFLRKHVKGKTNCKVEEIFISEIINFFKDNSPYE